MDDITEEMIRGLRDEADAKCEALLDTPGDEWAQWYATLWSARVALGEPAPFGKWDPVRARANCARILNARARKEPTP